MPRRIDRLTAGTLEGILADAEQAGRMRTTGAELNQYSAGKLLRLDKTTAATSFWVWRPNVAIQRTVIIPSTQPDGQVSLTDLPISQGALGNLFLLDNPGKVLSGSPGGFGTALDPYFASGIGNYARVGDQAHYLRVAGAVGGTFRILIPSAGVATGPIDAIASTFDLGLILAAAVGLTDLSALSVVAGGLYATDDHGVPLMPLRLLTPATWTIRFLGLGFELLNAVPWEIDASRLDGGTAQLWGLNLAVPRRNRYHVVFVGSAGIPQNGFLQLVIGGIPTPRMLFSVDPNPPFLFTFPTTASFRAALETVAGPGNVVVYHPESTFPWSWYRFDFVGEAQALEYADIELLWGFDADGTATLETHYDPTSFNTQPAGWEIVPSMWDTVPDMPLGRLVRLNLSDVFDSDRFIQWRSPVSFAAIWGLNTVGQELLPILSPGGGLFFWPRPNSTAYFFGYGNNQQYDDGTNNDGVSVALAEPNSDVQSTLSTGAHLGMMLGPGGTFGAAAAPLKLRLLCWVGDMQGGDINWIVLTPTFWHWSGFTFMGYPLCNVLPPVGLTANSNDPIGGSPVTRYTFGYFLGISQIGGLALFRAINSVGGAY